MNRRDVRKITIEYDDDTTVTFEQPGIFHNQFQIYSKGDMHHTQGRVENMIRWIENRSMWPKVEANG